MLFIERGVELGTAISLDSISVTTLTTSVTGILDLDRYRTTLCMLVHSETIFSDLTKFPIINSQNHGQDLNE